MGVPRLGKKAIVDAIPISEGATRRPLPQQVHTAMILFVGERNPAEFSLQAQDSHVKYFPPLL